MKSESTPPYRSRAFWVALASGPVVYAVGFLLSARPSLLESAYTGGIGPPLSWAISRLTARFPFSLAEILLILFVGWQIGRLLRPWIQRQRPLRERLRDFGFAALGTLRALSVVWAVFTLVWGLHYSRAPLPERWGWPELSAESTHEALEPMTRELVGLTNRYYAALHGSDDAGVPTQRDGTQVDQLEAALDASFARLQQSESLPRSFAWNWGEAKPLKISALLHRMGLSGFYFPWTAEANLNRDVPACAAAHVRAHEKSHQRGIARENEANFVAFLVGMGSDDPWARYSSALFAQRQALSALLRSDPEVGRELLMSRSPGVQRDVDDLRAYWDTHRGAWRKTARTVNHAYLRSQRVEGGIASYRGSLALLLRYSALAAAETPGER